MSLIQSLPDGPLDIVGDIHGEHDALCALLGHLGYDLDGAHPDGRTLVFVGDFCDVSVVINFGVTLFFIVIGGLTVNNKVLILVCHHHIAAHFVYFAKIIDVI